MNPTGTHIKCPHCNEFIFYDSNICQYCNKLIKEKPQNSHQSDLLTFIKNELKEKYEIYEIIGKGGMASVYKAKQINLDRTVALKIIHQNMVHDQEFVARFLEEAKISAQLSHPNIVNIYDFGKVGEIYYISMQFLDGRDLSKILQEKKTLPPEVAVTYAKEIANALYYIHNKGYLHRDIKSSNIFITADNKPVITDFGIAYHAGSTAKTVAGTLLGTPEYLSPEQAAGKEATPASDYYSLGIVLYECLTGQLPFSDTNPAVTISKITNDTPKKPASINPNIPKQTEGLILGLLSKNPDKRNVHIKTLLESKDIQVSRPIKQKAARKTNSLRITAIIILSILLIGIIATMVYITMPRTHQIGDLFREQPTLQPPPYDHQHAIESRETAPLPETRITDSPATSPAPTPDPPSPRPEPDTEPVAPVTLPDVVDQIESNMINFGDFKIMSTQVTREIWEKVRESDTANEVKPASNVIRGRGRYINNATYAEIQKFFNALNRLQGNPYHYDLPSHGELRESKNDASHVQLTGEVNMGLIMYLNPESRLGIENYIGRNQEPQYISEGLEITFNIVRRKN